LPVIRATPNEILSKSLPLASQGPARKRAQIL